jgi:hypothetical protein
MTTTNGNRKILDLKQWEFMAVAPATSAAGAFIASSRHFRQQQLFVRSNSEAFIYNPSEDGWQELASPALAGSFGAGAAGVAVAWSCGPTAGVGSLTATGGTTSTIITGQTLARDLRGYDIQILSGPNAGAVLEITSNTIGSNAVITVPTQASAFSASTVYRLLTPRWFVLGAGTLASGSFRHYDYASNSWVTASQTGLPATIATDGKLIATPSFIDGAFKSFATGTATSGTATTLVNSGKAWTTGQWVNFQIRITAGTGAGQIRTITANDATSVTVATWTTTPDATSQYSIEGNDNFLYYMGNSAVTLYRYDIAANTWSTLTPSVARGGAPGAGMSGHWVHSVAETDWNVENAILNGRYIYSFRGANGVLLDRYDIAANSWAAITYSPAATAFSTGTKYALHNGYLYIQKDSIGRWYYYDFARSDLVPWSNMLYPQGAAAVGDTAFDVIYKDGATEIYYVYMLLNSSNIMLRQAVI